MSLLCENRVRRLLTQSLTLTLGVLLAAPLNAFAATWQPNLRFVHLGTSDGLSHALTDAFAQDRHGFIWIGTRDGLDRFDGYEVVNFLHDPEDPASISAGQVMDVLVASDGAIWAAADQLNRYDPEKGSFTRYAPAPDEPGALGGVPLSLLEDAAGAIWIGTWNAGLYRLEPGSGTFERFGHDPDDPSSLPPGPVSPTRKAHSEL